MIKNGHKEESRSPVLKMTQNEMEIVSNIMISRQQLISKYLDPRRDVDKECGHPETHAINDIVYKELYDRGLGKRVVEIMPQESWKSSPEVYEVEDADTVTPFEEAWNNLGKSLLNEGTESLFQDEVGNPIWEILCRADILSGIGHYGVILLGLDDGLELSQPVQGIEETSIYPGGEQQDPYAPRGMGTDDQYHRPLYNYKLTVNEEFTAGRKLLFVRAFDESLVEITQYEASKASPRYGLPKMYQLTMNDPNENHTGIGLSTETLNVHWTRIIHLADNRNSSEIFGVPRMRACINHLLDLAKLYGGSAEMYWRGAFPGLSIETQPQLGAEVEIDKDSVRGQMTSYMNGLQRFLALQGMTAKSLAPQVVDPSAQVEVHITGICIILAVPKRLFMGSERGELSSGQDATTWNERLTYRRENYITPKVIVPFINRLIMIGVLPKPAGYSIKWPDLESLTEQEKATVAGSKTSALSTYVSAGLDTLIPPLDFLTRIMEFTEEEAIAILEAAAEAQAQLAEQQATQQQEQQYDENGQPIQMPQQSREPIIVDKNKNGIDDREEDGGGNGKDSEDNPKGGNPFAKKNKEPVENEDSWERYQEFIRNNCGTGAGGFQPGNTCAGGSPEERTKLVTDSAPMVKAIAYTRFKDTQHREDAAQEALMQLYKHADKWNPERGAWNKWASTVSVRAMQNYAKKLNRRQRKEIVQPLDPITGEIRRDPYEKIDPVHTEKNKSKHRYYKQLYKAIAYLPENHQYVVRQSLMGDSQAEIAQHLNVSVQRVSQMQIAAREKLEKLMYQADTGFDVDDMFQTINEELLANAEAAKKAKSGEDNPHPCGDDGPAGFQEGNTCGKKEGGGSEGGSKERGSFTEKKGGFVEGVKESIASTGRSAVNNPGAFAAGAVVGGATAAVGGAVGAAAGGTVGGLAAGAVSGGVLAVPGAFVGELIGGFIGGMIGDYASSTAISAAGGGEDVQAGASVGSLVGGFANIGHLGKTAKTVGKVAKKVGTAAKSAPKVLAKAGSEVAEKVSKPKSLGQVFDAAKSSAGGKEAANKTLALRQLEETVMRHAPKAINDHRNLVAHSSKATLAPKELKSIAEYSGSSTMINSELRALGKSGSLDSLSNSAKEAYIHLSSAIAKQGKLDTPVTVYRGVESPKFMDMISKIGIGGVYQSEGFASTTLRKNLAEKFSDVARIGKGTVLEIKAKTGIYAAPFSRVDQELEFIQNHGTKYKITGMLKEGDRLRVLMEEL